MPEVRTKTDYVHIVCVPGVVGDEPRIARHGVRVRDIVAARLRLGVNTESSVLDYRGGVQDSVCSLGGTTACSVHSAATGHCT